jgi:L-threonylcarbamoyladenylate synthase
LTGRTQATITIILTIFLPINLPYSAINRRIANRIFGYLPITKPLTRTTSVMSASQFQLQRAAQLLNAGSVIAYPTEAVWGLGCDPHNDSALNLLLDIKGRPANKGLILIAASVDQLTDILDQLSASDRQKVMATWPGPVTWVLPHFGTVSDLISGGRDTVAVRVTAHPIAAALCMQFGGALVSTSANPTDHAPAKTRLRVAQYFGGNLPVVNGELGGLNKPTKIQTLCGDLIRP